MHQIKVLLGVVILALVALSACDGRQSGAKAPVSGDSQAASVAADKAGPEGENSGEAEMAASSEEEATLWVMQARGNRQCEGGGMSLEQSRGALEKGGITVVESRCAVRTDRMYPSVCGGATGDMLAHRIPVSMLDAALELEFDPASKIPHNFTECPADTGPGAKPTH